ncbi:MAG TPA: ABC transporter substrate-binding protein [Vicinamibacterales bacterium]|nr:ABC transporter substrate-binding protein [Vicinamibacterales bacterium]
MAASIRTRPSLFLFLAGLAVAGPVPAAWMDTIAIGVVYNLHGFQANLDVPSARGARLAVEEINREGGVLGRELQLVIVDGVSNPTVIEHRTFPLLKRFPDMPALMGLSDTDMVLAAAPVAANARRVFLTSGATSPLLPEQVPGYLFLACFGDNVQAAAAAEVAFHDLKARSVGVLFATDNTYTSLLQAYFRERFTGLGGEVDLVREYQPGALEGIADGLADVDLVFLATGSADESLAIIHDLRAAGIEVPVFGGDSYDSEQLWQQHPDIQNVFFTTHAYLGADNPDPVVQEFRRAYSDAYAIAPDAFAALGYDTARLLATAIETAGSTDPLLVREALAGIADFDGVTGSMHYPPESRIPLKAVTVLLIRQGTLVLFLQLTPTEVPAPGGGTEGEIDRAARALRTDLR